MLFLDGSYAFRGNQAVFHRARRPVGDVLNRLLDSLGHRIVRVLERGRHRLRGLATITPGTPVPLHHARAEQPEVGGIPEAARRLQERPEFVAWLPYVQQMQLDQIETHGMRLERAQNVLQQLLDYAAGIGDGD